MPLRVLNFHSIITLTYLLFLPAALAAAERDSDLIRRENARDGSRDWQLTRVALTNTNGVRAAYILSTLEMTRLLVTPAVIADIPRTINAHVVAGPEPLRFDAEGDLELDRYWGAG